MKHFCAADGGFYSLAFHGFLPDGCVEVSDEDYQALLAGQEQGKRIVAGDKGCPVLIDPPAASADEIWEKIKGERERRTSAGFNVSGQWVHSDLFSRSQWLGLKDTARDVLTAGGTMGDTLHDNLGQAIAWKMLGGAFVPVTAQLAFDVVAAVTCSDMAIFTAAEQHNAAMRAAAAPARYDYLVNWPPTYAEWAATQEPG